MNNSTKTAMSVILVGALGVGGLSTATKANSAIWDSRDLISQAVEDEKNINDEQETEEEQESEKDEEVDEQKEAIRLQPLAKITADQAKEAALKVQSGEVKELELEAENGSLVYEVTVGETEVFVDAGNGKVLYTQGVNEKVDEATEQARPRSSIQVPDEDNAQ